MRRRDREITDREEMEILLQAAQVCRLAMADGEEPYVVPLCFGYASGSFYFHSAIGGRKIDILKKNPRVCIEADSTAGPIRDADPCAWGMRYASVICTGRARFIEDETEKRDGLNCILRHYGEGPHPFDEGELANVCVIRVDAEQMTGKKHE